MPEAEEQNSRSNDARAFSMETQLEAMRVKLLDTSLRNTLLNFRHSEKSQAHIRIIDELPDVLYKKLLADKELNFNPLPPLDTEPQDEKTPEFVGLFKQYSIIDEIYLKEIEASADDEDPFHAVAKAERKLKNRIREEIGLPPLENIKSMTNAEWARENGIEPKYDLPKVDGDDMAKKHSDDLMQTLLKPKELAHKLLGLKRYISTDINETGVNTLYATFGFLQWQDSESSEKNILAPLVIVQLDPVVEKKQASGQIKYSVKASGEEPQNNLSLKEKLKQFNIVLPEFDAESDTPESYFLKIEKAVAAHPRWRVRRFITLGRLQFSKLIMYKDLDPTNWPANVNLAQHKVLRKILTGERGTQAEQEAQTDIYDIDRNAEVERHAPLLVTEADSSQHSVIVDVIKGKNLVVQGPPGTGKSQTITNLIANAIAQGKKVLFVAEKMAALDVVYSRLKDAGLGDFCLELHSTKTKLKDLRVSLDSCIRTRQRMAQPRELNERLTQLKKLKVALRAYADVLEKPCGEYGKSVHDMLWLEQSKREISEAIHPTVRRIRVPSAERITPTMLFEYRQELDYYEKIRNDVRSFLQGEHPWNGVGANKISTLLISEIIDLFNEWAIDIQKLNEAISEHLADWQFNGPITAGSIKKLFGGVYTIKRLMGQVEDLSSLRSYMQGGGEVLGEDLSKNIEAYKSANSELGMCFDEPARLLSEHSAVFSNIEASEKLWVDSLTKRQLDEKISALTLERDAFQKVISLTQKASELIFGETNPTVEQMRLLLKSQSLLANVNRETLLNRRNQLSEESSLKVIEELKQSITSLNELKSSLNGEIDLEAQCTVSEIEQAIKELSNAKLLSIFASNYRTANKFYRSVRMKQLKETQASKLVMLRNFRRYKEEFSQLNSDERLVSLGSRFHAGVEKDLSTLAATSQWMVNAKKSLFGFSEDHKKATKFVLEGDLDNVDYFSSVASGFGTNDNNAVTGAIHNLPLATTLEFSSASISSIFAFFTQNENVRSCSSN